MQYIVYDYLGKWSKLAISKWERAYFLSLMDALFTPEEMAISCFYSSSRSTKSCLSLKLLKVLVQFVQ